MKLKHIALMLATASLWVGTAYAGTCEIQYTRTACPDKEDISFKKCKGKASCSKFKEAEDAMSCKKMAVEACANDRVTVTKSKVVNATFDGAKLQTDAANDDFCTAYPKAAEEFNRCDG